MTDTPADPPPWQTGPPPGYEPPPTTDLVDPAVREHTHTTGRAACIAAIEAATGKTKTADGRWVDAGQTSEGA
jgi:hypothetical protein